MNKNKFERKIEASGKLFVFFAVIVLSLNFFSVVSAHEVVEGGTATMLVHIDPNDTPIARKPTTVHIDLTNTEKGFSLENCDCVLTIGQDDKPLLTQKLVAGNDTPGFNTKDVNFIFPAEGKYDITVVGTPTTKGLFTPFTTDYDTDVAAQAEPVVDHNTTVNDSLPKTLLLIPLALLVLLIFFFLKFRNEKPE